VWVRRSAIRPVPRYARVPASAVAAVEATFAGADERTRRLCAEGFDRFSAQQQALAKYMVDKLPQSLDDAALALGHMLGVAVFAAFETFPAEALRRLDADAVAAVDAALGADEELRRVDPMDALDSEDIVAIEQPALMAFVNKQIGLTLSEHAQSIDIDHVALVFRAVLVEILALSHAVAPPRGYPVGHGEEPMA
jgi:hypothetical protein